MIENKIVYGLDKIHYLKDGVIKPLKGAISVEIIISQEVTYRKKYGCDAVKFSSPIRGKGKLKVIGLSLEEQSDLLGYVYSNGELAIGENPNAPHVSLLFARQLENGGELYSVFYNCVFENKNINALTKTNDISEEEVEIAFDVLVDTNRKLLGFVLDTKDTSNKNKVNNFFKSIQVPERR